MALFRLGPSTDNAHFIKGDGIYLRPGQMRDFDQWRWVREFSRDFLIPWEPTWGKDDLTRSAFRARLRRHGDEINRDEAYPFFIFRARDDVLMGGITLGQVRRGVAQCATLGYWMGKPHAGKGHMAKAVRAAAGFAFDTLRLHRLEAACLPHNAASMRLLEGVGFTREGYARAYLKINGVWQDHVLYGLLEHDPVRPSLPR
jgi:ribosomal-protein-alanine N-acetyltransferase